jgi:hypothetical protein
MEYEVDMGQGAIGEYRLSTSEIYAFTIDGKSINVQDIISKLKFISKIEEGEKMVSEGVSHPPDIVPDTRWNNFLRTVRYASGSKKDTLNFIRDTSNCSLEIARRCFASKDQYHNRIAHLIIESLKEIDVGIQNIIKTNSKHRWFVAEVETFRQILDAKINSLVLSATGIS